MSELRIEGYASVFWAPDHGCDVVAQGAFGESLALTGVLAGNLVVSTSRISEASPTGRLCAALVRAGALDGLSIGFRTRRARSDPERKLRVLTEVDLLEVSLVAFPLLTEARLRAAA